MPQLVQPSGLAGSAISALCNTAQAACLSSHLKSNGCGKGEKQGFASGLVLWQS